MNVLIKSAKGNGGRDTKMYRAYTVPDETTGQNHFGRQGEESLSISASTTGNEEFGILRCAAKSFAKMKGIPLTGKNNQAIEKQIHKIEKMIILDKTGSGNWMCSHPDEKEGL